MKTNKKHIIIPALMAAIGVGLVGSISGTVAWYQYSTRVTAAYIGTSAKASENLQIQAKSADGTKVGAWAQDLNSETVHGIIDGATEKYGQALTPVTTGEQAKDGVLASLKGHPIYQYNLTSQWGAASVANYVAFDLSFRTQDIDGTGTAYYAKNVYLTDVTIKINSANDSIDLDKAVRVHISAPGASGAAVNALFSKEGADTDVYGPLDLNNDNAYDKGVGYEWDTTSQLVYGDDGKKQTAYAASNGAAPSAANNAILANDTNTTLSGGKALCKTAADGSVGASQTIRVTIWLEGWQKLETAPTGNKDESASESAVWDAATYIGKKFNVGLRFAVQPVGVADY